MVVGRLAPVTCQLSRKGQSKRSRRLRSPASQEVDVRSTYSSSRYSELAVPARVHPQVGCPQGRLIRRSALSGCSSEVLPARVIHQATRSPGRFVRQLARKGVLSGTSPAREMCQASRKQGYFVRLVARKGDASGKLLSTENCQPGARARFVSRGDRPQGSILRWSASGKGRSVGDVRKGFAQAPPARVGTSGPL